MNLMTAIQNTIFDTVLAAYAVKSDDPSSSPYQNQEVVVGRIWPGQIIDETQYGNAWSPTNPKGVMAATENLSILVDPIPNMNEWYSKSGRRVEEMYEFMIKSAKTVLSSIEEHGLLSNTQTRSIKSIDTNALPHNVKSELTEQKIVEAYLPDKSNIQTLFMTPEAIKKKHLEIAHSNAAAAAVAYRLAYEKAHTNVRSMTRGSQIKSDSQLEEIKRKAWDELRKVGSGPLSRAQALYTPNSINNSFYEANLIFSRSTLASVRNPGIAYHPTYTSPENWVDPSAKESWPLLTIPVADTNPAVELTITFSRIDIIQPWLMASLFELDGWTNDQGPGSFSTGKLMENDGSFSLLPQSMIVARDILARTFTGTVYRSSGLQVLAYISKLVPYAPPS